MRIGYGSKTLATVLALGFISTALLSWAVVDSAERGISESVEDKLKGVLDSKQDALEQWLDGQVDTLRSTTYHPGLSEDAEAVVDYFMGGAAAPQARSRMSALLNSTASPVSQPAVPMLIEAVSGRIVLCPRQASWEGQVILHEDLIVRAANGPGVLYIPNVSISWEPWLLAAVPVTDPSSGIVAVLGMASGHLAVSSVLAKPRGLGDTAAVFLVGQDGRLLTNAPGDRSPGERTPSEGAATALAGISGWGTYTGSSEVEVMGAYVPLERWDMALVVEIDREDALSEMVLIRLSASAAGVIISMALIIIAFLLTRALTRDLEGLVRWSSEIGHGNWEAELNLGGTAEAQDLEQAFRQMVRDLQKQQAQLRAAERRYANLFRSSLDPVFTARPDGLITELNTSGERVLGIPRQPDGTYGKKLWELFGEPTELHEFQRRLDREGAVAGFEARLVLSSGRELVSLLSITRRYDDSGRLTHLQGVVHDITDRKRFESALIDAKNQAEFYCDIMSHDLNNAIQGLGGYLELAALASDVDDVNEFLPAAQEQLNRASVLLRNVRRLSRMGSRAVEVTPMDLRKALDRCMKAVTRAHSPVSVKFDVDLPDGPVMVMAEEFLDDVLMNLLDNAVKYDPHETKQVEVAITRSVRDDIAWWQMRVKDRGPGVADRDKRTIFGRFERRTLNEYGTGLGLSIVIKATERCGGTAWVEDRVPGDHSKGACFVVELVEVPGASEAASMGPKDELSPDAEESQGPWPVRREAGASGQPL